MTMIDFISEQAIPLGEAARIYGTSRGGRPTHVSTVLRHITRGTRLPSGEIIYLEGARLGGRWVTTREAVQRYIERLTEAALGQAQCAPAHVRTSASRQRELTRVDRSLDAAGIR
jgi:hypothetical protein